MLTRIMKQISEVVGEQGTRVRDRLRTIGHRVMEIARLSRSQGQEPKEKREEKYREWVRWTRQVRNQAQRFSEEIPSGEIPSGESMSLRLATSHENSRA